MHTQGTRTVFSRLALSPGAVATTCAALALLSAKPADALPDFACYAWDITPLYWQIVAGLKVLQESHAIGSHAECERAFDDASDITSLVGVSVPNSLKRCACNVLSFSMPMSGTTGGALTDMGPGFPITSLKFDFDGDGKSDPTVYRVPTGTWYSRPSAGGQDLVVAFGTSTDIPIPGDYDGDGRTDRTVYRPSNGTWYSHLSQGAPDLAMQFGVKTDIPEPADYDGDNKTDYCVYRPVEWNLVYPAPRRWS